MPRPAQISWAALRVNRHLNGAGSILGRDACADAVFRAGIHAHCEGGLVVVGVAVDHQRQVKLVEPLALHRQADQAAGLGGHEIDLLRRGELRRTDQITLVFAVFVVDHDDRLAIANCSQGIGDRIERNAVEVV
jgi:hypothetical protein